MAKDNETKADEAKAPEATSEVTQAQAPVRNKPIVTISDTPPEVPPEFSPEDKLAPVNLGAERTSQIAKEISESSGDPIRDQKLMEEHGSLYDPATSPDDLRRASDRTKVDRFITPATEAEMEAGREALHRRNGGRFQRDAERNNNVNVERPNTAESFRNRK